MVIFLDITKVLSGNALGLTRGALPHNWEVRLAFGLRLTIFPLFGGAKVGNIWLTTDFPRKDR